MQKKNQVLKNRVAGVKSKKVKEVKGTEEWSTGKKVLIGTVVVLGTIKLADITLGVAYSLGRNLIG